MRTIAILPVKSFGAAKQRLASALGGGSRYALTQAMFSDVLAALRRTHRLDAVAVVTADHEAEATARGERVLVLEEDVHAGQSAAATIGIRHAVASGFERVLLVPGDTPLVEPGAIDLLLERSEAERRTLTIVPDRHRTGTNALVITPPNAFEPSFGPGSLERHLGAARQAELPCAVEDVDSLMHDVDTPEDLADLSAVLQERRAVAPRTRGTLRQLDRLQIGAPEPGSPDGAGVAVEV